MERDTGEPDLDGRRFNADEMNQRRVKVKIYMKSTG